MAVAADKSKLHRSPAGPLGGVCAGLGETVGINPIILRVAFVLAAVLGGIGIPLYLVLWLVLPADEGSSFFGRLRGRPGSWQVAGGVFCLTLAALLTVRELGIFWSDAVVWPLVLALSGGVLVWRQSTRSPARPATAVPGSEARSHPLAPPAARPPRPAPGATADTHPAAPPARPIDWLRRTYQGGFGIALVIGAGLLFLQITGAVNGVRDVVLGVVTVVIGAALVLAPFWLRLVRGLDAERAARIRSQERAEVAAHLHDSVLQTLALVQKRAGDARAVAALARRQERELRAWLSDEPALRPDDRLADALREAAREIEDEHGVPIEVITVGDRALDDDASRALVAAAREALSNAVRHAGAAGPVALYAEVAGGRTEVFVRDRGEGFDLAAVPADRRGVRESILGRMARHGGHAEVRAAPGGGTEVELVLESGS